MTEQNITIEEILNFNIGKDLGLDLLPEKEQEGFNQRFFANLIERIIKKTSEKLSPENQEKIIKMIENDEELEKVFNFISDKNENFIEEVGEEFLDFKKEVYELLKK